MHTAESDKSIASIRINGGLLCLDFVNTASWAGLEVDREFLCTTKDAKVWGLRQGLAVGHAALSDAELTSVRDLRRSIRALALDHRGFQAEDLARLNAALAGIDAVVASAESADFAIRAHCTNAAAWLTAPIALSAAALLASPERARISVCNGEGCHWLFLDTSRGGTRRWCSMESCGNRAKARAHYEAHRQPQANRPAKPKRRAS